MHVAMVSGLQRSGVLLRAEVNDEAFISGPVLLRIACRRFLRPFVWTYSLALPWWPPFGCGGSPRACFGWGGVIALGSSLEYIRRRSCFAGVRNAGESVRVMSRALTMAK